MFNDYGDIITIEEMCELLRIGKNTAYSLLTSGKVKAFREGRKWKIPRIALESYVLANIGFK
jgi:excisionase family DNA binding protein